MNALALGSGLIIFDCDGVVVDSEMLACRTLAEVLRRYSVPVDLDEIFERFLGRSFAVVEAHYRAVRGEPMPARFREDYGAALAEAYRASLRPMPHVEDVLSGLGRPYCLASSSGPDRIRLTLHVTRLAAYFGERVYSAEMAARGKPAPDLFLLVAERMGVPPAEALVVEDSVSGVTAAKAAGMTVWGFTGGSHCVGREIGSQLLAAGADRVFSSMRDFDAG